MLNAKRQIRSEGDPRADYTRSLVKLVRIGDLASDLAPHEVFEAICEAVAKPLELSVVVVIDALQGQPRVLSWKGEQASCQDVTYAEWRAWSCFATLVQPDWPTELLATPVEPDPNSTLDWTVQPLGAPPRGVIECGTRRPLHHVDHGLLKCMSARLSSAFGRVARSGARRETG
jgi:hypothetical protein